MLRPATLAASIAASAVVLLALAVPGCASQECDFNSQCGERAYCERGRCWQDCREDFDCATGMRCNLIGQCRPADEVDGGPPPTLDAGPPTPGVDAGPPIPGVDAGPPPRDAGPPVTPDAGPPVTPDAGPLGRYLDRCNTAADCASGQCVDDTGGTRMCSRSCGTHSDCASEHVCAAGQCRRDDTGAVCSGSAACVLGLCAGDPSMGTGRCTRPCGSASDCPGGYACADAGGVFICVNIEQGCATCGTGLCLAGPAGCTSSCRSAADCPTTLTGMPYSCQSNLCVPHASVMGSDPIGAPCSASGTNTCRSAACLVDGARTMCTQRCTEAGGCGPGFGCIPEDDGGGGVVLVCSRGGAGALTSSCTTGDQCDSGICDGGRCTRLCTRDSLCPTGLRCVPRAGHSVCAP